jgi:hypothetical protein
MTAKTSANGQILRCDERSRASRLESSRSTSRCLPSCAWICRSLPGPPKGRGRPPLTAGCTLMGPQTPLCCAISASGCSSYSMRSRGSPLRAHDVPLGDHVGALDPTREQLEVLSLGSLRDCSVPRAGTPRGNRIPVSTLKGWRPRPLDDGGPTQSSTYLSGPANRIGRQARTIDADSRPPPHFPPDLRASLLSLKPCWRAEAAADGVPTTHSRCRDPRTSARSGTRLGIPTASPEATQTTHPVPPAPAADR